MKLTEVYEKSLRQIIEECNIVDQKFHTDESGEIKSIELKFVPKDSKPEAGVKIPDFMKR